MQHNLSPSRFECATGNILDLVLTDHSVVIPYVNTDAPVGTGDHNCLYFPVPFNIHEKLFVEPAAQKYDWCKITKMLNLNLTDYESLNRFL